MNLTAQSLEDQFLGRVCITHEDSNCLLNQRIARIIPESIDRDFLFWQFKGKYFREHVDLAPKGTKVKHLYNNDLDKALIPFPKQESEQKHIARILWNQDDLIRRLHRDLKNQQKIKTGLMQDLLTGKVRVDALMKENKIVEII